MERADPPEVLPAHSPPAPGTPHSTPWPRWPGWATAAVVCAIYLAVASGGTLRFGPSLFPHHVLVADAWLHGQLHLRESVLEARDAEFLGGLRAKLEAEAAARGGALSEAQWQRVLSRMSSTPTRHDLSRYEGRDYAYWAPLPAVLLLPYVALVGVQASDVLLACLLAAGTVLLIYLALREAAARSFLSVTGPAAVAIALLLGLGTVQFYLAVTGWVWHLSQIAATFFLGLSIWLALRGGGTGGALAAGAAFGASFLARHSVLLTLPFFACALHAHKPGRRALLRAVAAFCAPLMLAGCLQLAFNQLRFGSAFEDGWRIQLESGANPSFKQDFEAYGGTSLHYLPRNAYYYFANFNLPRHPSGAVTFDPYGNSMFLVTPALLLALLAWRSRTLITLGAAVASAAGLGLLLVFIGTGWYNFGNRYLLELLPFLLILVAAGTRGRLTPALAVLIATSIAVNTWGTWRFLVQQP